MARARGEKHGRAKLTDDEVREIKTSTGTVYGLAKRFRVSRRQIMRIQSGEHWRHL